MRLLKTHGDLPSWVAYCLTGLLDLEDRESSSLGAVEVDDTKFLARVGDPGLDRWQRFLAAVGYRRVCRAQRVQFPKSARAILSLLRRETLALLTVRRNGCWIRSMNFFRQREGRDTSYAAQRGDEADRLCRQLIAAVRRLCFTRCWEKNDETSQRDRVTSG